MQVFWSCNWCNKEHVTDSEDKVPASHCDSKECQEKWEAAEAKRIAKERAAAEAASPAEEVKG